MTRAKIDRQIYIEEARSGLLGMHLTRQLEKGKRALRYTQKRCCKNSDSK